MVLVPLNRYQKLFFFFFEIIFDKQKNKRIVNTYVVKTIKVETFLLLHTIILFFFSLSLFIANLYCIVRACIADGVIGTVFVHRVFQSQKQLSLLSFLSHSRYAHCVQQCLVVIPT